MSEIYNCVLNTQAEASQTKGADTLFPYWSFTKTAIAIIAMRLSERGIIELDDTFPAQEFTFRQLLNHTSGMPDYVSLPSYQDDVAADEEPWFRNQMLAEVYELDTLFAPGEGWAYSNSWCMQPW